MLRIPVDFNTITADEKERVHINTFVFNDLAQKLHNGLRVVLFEPDLEVEATVEFDNDLQEWFGIPDWSTRIDLPYPPPED
jgi:hypothetical protein